MDLPEETLAVISRSRGPTFETVFRESDFISALAFYLGSKPFEQVIILVTKLGHLIKYKHLKVTIKRTSLFAYQSWMQESLYQTEIT